MTCSDQRERAIVHAQIGRAPRGRVEVAARCALGLPAVVAVPPVLEGGEPFPTRYWLSCPLAVRRIARLEAVGGVADAERRAQREPAFAEALERAHRRYASERDRLVPAGARRVPAGGVGGARGGVKCQHAHYADHAAGNDNPVGAAVAPEVEPLDCAQPCVVAGADGAMVRNPAWREPRNERV